MSSPAGVVTTGVVGAVRHSCVAAIVGAALAFLASACSGPLPEEGSPIATLYRTRCGGCHAAFQPRTLTPTMWKLQVDRMEQKYRAAGIPVPEGAEKEQIMAYLTKYAGG